MDFSRQPRHILAKPTGARCNSACDYCFFLKKERLYPGSDIRIQKGYSPSRPRKTPRTRSMSSPTVSLV